MTTIIRLVDTGWDRELDTAVAANHTTIKIICPFLQQKTLARLLRYGTPSSIQVITRFHLGNFCDGVSDLAALRLLMAHGATIRGIRDLHAKVYLFGDARVIVTSANLTETALGRNHEFGFVSDDHGVMTRCQQYFDALWQHAGADLTAARLDAWAARIRDIHAQGARPSLVAGLPDEGANVTVPQLPVVVSPVPTASHQAFIKFFGEGHNRVDRHLSIFEEVERSGCHWACTYPKDRRPRQVEDGAVMFLARMVHMPNDIMIFGRAIGMRYQQGRDDATLADIQERPWKDRWPHYIRVHHAEFVAGALENGIALSDLVNTLGSSAFASTAANAARGTGNTNPRLAVRQQAAVRLSEQGYAWLAVRLDSAFQTHGMLAPATLDTLDWPEIPASTI